MEAIRVCGFGQPQAASPGNGSSQRVSITSEWLNGR
jgi:hypothetical protein